MKHQAHVFFYPASLLLHQFAAHNAWLSLITYLSDKVEISEVCEGTNKKNDRQYYLDRKRNIGDLHGQAPIL